MKNRKNISPSFQKGMGMTEIMVLLVIIGFVATTAVKLGPVYLDNSTVTSAFESIQEDYAGKDIQEISNTDIKRKLGKYFQVNMVSSEIEKSIEVVRKGRSVIVKSDYEIRQPFMGNVEIVVVFQNEVDLSK